jgi:hypothetical protein
MNPAEDPKNLPPENLPPKNPLPENLLPENLPPGLFYQMDGLVSDQ